MQIKNLLILIKRNITSYIEYLLTMGKKIFIQMDIERFQEINESLSKLFPTGQALDFTSKCFCKHFITVFKITMWIMSWLTGVTVNELDLMVAFFTESCENHKLRMAKWFDENLDVGDANCLDLLWSMAFNFCNLIFQIAAYEGNTSVDYTDFIFAMYEYGAIGSGQWPWGED